MSRILVTGSSGFIGTHLCRALQRRGCNGNLLGMDLNAPASPGYQFFREDVAQIPDAPRYTAEVVCHLAAMAEVVIPFAELGALATKNVVGTHRLLAALDPELLVFASSSAVYGNTPLTGAPADFNGMRPVGAYGASKAFAEFVIRDWALARNKAAVLGRFGNVIGPGCRGFIPFLVRHAMKFPDGNPPAQCRGGGKLVRDYVPVDYVVSLLIAASEATWPRGEATPLNVGTGRGLTNREIAELVVPILDRRGLKLRIDWSSAPGAGEAGTVVLGRGGALDKLDVPLPTHEEVAAAVYAAVDAAIKAESKAESPQ